MHEVLALHSRASPPAIMQARVWNIYMKLFSDVTWRKIALAKYI